MPFQPVSTLWLRREFVELARQPAATIRELCRRFRISSRTAYKWLNRLKQEGLEGWRERCHRPHPSPPRTAAQVERAVLKVQDEHPAWATRKLRARLEALGKSQIPAPSTIPLILQRHQRIDPAESAKHKAFQRFEHEAPNQLSQMDFKGYFLLSNEQRCHPLTVLDDPSRLALCLEACADQQTETVQQPLTAMFRRSGLPERIHVDKGSPWGDDSDHPYTPLAVWLLRLYIAVSHSRPYHPQTQGQEERFHRTLEAEVIRGSQFRSFSQGQPRFDQWRYTYNQERPHQALEMAVPASRYQVSRRAFPEVLPAIEYAPDDRVRKVQDKGEIYFQGRLIRLSKAFRGHPVALRPRRKMGSGNCISVSIGSPKSI
jgi:transposase InsO family protein